MRPYYSASKLIYQACRHIGRGIDKGVGCIDVRPYRLGGASNSARGKDGPGSEILTSILTAVRGAPFFILMLSWTGGVQL